MANKVCVWQQQEEWDMEDCWQPSCVTHLFQIAENEDKSTPSKQGMRFCCYCGKPLKEKTR